jgi:hypothetical protein
MKNLLLNALVLVTLLLLSSCAPKRSNDAARIDSLRTQAEELIKAQSLMGWNNWVRGAVSNQDSLYRANANLFTAEHIALVQKVEQEDPDPIQKKRLGYLRRYLTTEYISKEIALLTDRVNNIESNAKISFEGKEIAYRQVATLITNEMRQKRRAALYAALDPILDSLTVTLLEIEKSNQRLAKELGYTSYNAMAESLKGLSLDQFKSVTEQVLAQTESTYTTLLREMTKKYLNIIPARLYRYDMGALFRSRTFDKYFPARTMLGVVKSTYKGLGIDVDAQKNMKIDADPRDQKNPRAVCFPIDIPNDIRLSIKPVGGYDDYLSLFHEMGHAQHYANTKENAFEFKYTGEGTVTESFAFLSEYLLLNQAWLRLHTNMPAPVLKDFLRFEAFYRLFYLRRYSAKFLYELQLHSGVPDPYVRYANFLSRAVGYKPLPSDEKRYLVDLDAFYYSASYLRAWFLEAQLNERLTRDFGVNWFERPQAGTYQQTLWERGDRIDGDELAREIGYEGISPGALWKEIQMMLLFSTK